PPSSSGFRGVADSGAVVSDGAVSDAVSGVDVMPTFRADRTVGAQDTVPAGDCRWDARPGAQRSRGSGRAGPAALGGPGKSSGELLRHGATVAKAPRTRCSPRRSQH